MGAIRDAWYYFINKEKPVAQGRLTVTGSDMRAISRLPQELDSLDSLIRSAADSGEVGAWLVISEGARSQLLKNGFECSTDQSKHPGKTWIWWG